MSGISLCCLLAACVLISSTAGIQRNGGPESPTENAERKFVTLKKSPRQRFAVKYREEFCEKFRCESKACVRKFKVNFVNIGDLHLVVLPLRKLNRFFPANVQHKLSDESFPASKKSVLEKDSGDVAVIKRWGWGWWYYCWK